jgi:hypothetical protein
LAHMAAYTLFYPLSHFPVTLPGKAKTLEELTKLVVVHEVTISKPRQGGMGSEFDGLLP